jgi:hypothetical protein
MVFCKLLYTIIRYMIEAAVSYIYRIELIVGKERGDKSRSHTAQRGFVGGAGKYSLIRGVHAVAERDQYVVVGISQRERFIECVNGELACYLTTRLPAHSIANDGEQGTARQKSRPERVLIRLSRFTDIRVAEKFHRFYPLR